MAKRRIYKRSENGESTKVIARQLHQLYTKHESTPISREYGDLKNMELADSNMWKRRIKL